MQIGLLAWYQINQLNVTGRLDFFFFTCYQLTNKNYTKLPTNVQYIGNTSVNADNSITSDNLKIVLHIFKTEIFFEALSLDIII